MADIKPYTDQIAQAVYGEEVRSSIINALNKVNDDNNSYQDIKNEIVQVKDDIDEQVENFDAKVADAQSATTALETAISSATTAKTNLQNTTITANAIKTNLSNALTTANTAKSDLQTATTEANTAKTNAETAKTNLDVSITSANTAKTNLETAISNANTAKSNLDTSTKTGQTAKTNLETAISNANTAKSQLETVISNADTIKSDLSSVILSANTAKSNLDTSVSTANGVYQSLQNENASASSNLEELRSENFNSQEILTGVEDIKAYLGYTDEDIVGLQVDFQNKVFKRLAGAVNLTASADFDKFEMFGGRKRCNVLDDGTIAAYYGDENYAEDGSNGQVMVYQPSFYYKVVPLVVERNTESGIGYHLRKANYYVSTKPKTGFKLHPAFNDSNGNKIDYILYSAYEGTMYDTSANAYVYDNTDSSTDMDLTADLICSVASKKPISGQYKNLSKMNFEKMAANRGTGWHCDTIKSVSANQLLMMIEMGTMNLQSAIGQGVVSITDDSVNNCASNTGSTSDLGNSSGQATSTLNLIGNVSTNNTVSGKVSVTYRGVENPWGNIWKHIQGINIWGDGTMCGGQPYIADDFAFNESKHTDNYKAAGFTVPNASGYINAMGWGGDENSDFDWLLMPSETGGSTALPVGDYCYVASNLNGYRIARLGGSWTYGTNAGGFSWDLLTGVGTRTRSIGGRLVYVPTATA